MTMRYTVPHRDRGLRACCARLDWRSPRTRSPRPRKRPSARTPRKMVPSLAVLNSGGAKLEGGKLTMSGIAPNSIVFADRPVRAAGHVLTVRFHQAVGRGQRQFRQGPSQCDDIGDEQRRIGDRGRRCGSEDPEARRRQSDVRGNGAGRRVPAPTGPRRCSLTGSLRAAGFGRVGVVGGLGWHAPVWHGGWYGHPGAYGAGLATGAVIGAAAASAYQPVLSSPRLRLLPLSALLLERCRSA